METEKIYSYPYMYNLHLKTYYPLPPLQVVHLSESVQFVSDLSTMDTLFCPKFLFDKVFYSNKSNQISSRFFPVFLFNENINEF